MGVQVINLHGIYIRRVNRLVLLAIGHNSIDNRRHFSNESKNYLNGKICHCRIRKVQLIPQFYFFLWKAQKKAFACAIILSEISDFLF